MLKNGRTVTNITKVPKCLSNQRAAEMHDTVGRGAEGVILLGM